jgi:hypothetical protein
MFLRDDHNYTIKIIKHSVEVIVPSTLTQQPMTAISTGTDTTSPQPIINSKFNNNCIHPREATSSYYFRLPMCPLKFIVMNQSGMDRHHYFSETYPNTRTKMG